MLKNIIDREPSFAQLGRYEFSMDECFLAGFMDFDNKEGCEALQEIFDADLNDIVAAMWTFNQGLLLTDIVNSRLEKYDLDLVWHARDILNTKIEKNLHEDFCRMVHILIRLKGWHKE